MSKAVVEHDRGLAPVLMQVVEGVEIAIVHAADQCLVCPRKHETDPSNSYQQRYLPVRGRCTKDYIVMNSKSQHQPPQWLR